MNREDFIKHSWSPYPHSGQIPKGALCGRVESLSFDLLKLRGADKSHSLRTSQVVPGNHSQLGPTCPWDCLAVGDWVVWEPKNQGLYLMSPCLHPKEPLFDTNAKVWSEFLRDVESFFVSRDFIHLRTPFLVPSPGVDHHIDFLKVEACRTHRQWTLPTSPEIHLKKFLCQGYQKIFEIKNCFRDDLPGPQHKVEFTMLEWYRAFASLDEIVEDLKALMESLSGCSLDIELTSVSQIFLQKTGYSLTPETSQAELVNWAQNLNVEISKDDDWNDVFFRIFMERVEPGLGKDGPIILKNFPSQQASLAQINSEGWAERFELFWRGVELANAYLEVNDPKENKSRFASEDQLRKQSESEQAPLDRAYFEFIESGMPPASGIALGLDRLFSVLEEEKGLS